MRAAADALNALVEDAIEDWSAGDSRRLVIVVSDLRKSCMECWKSGKGGEDDESKDAARGVVDAMVGCAQVRLGFFINPILAPLCIPSLTYTTFTRRQVSLQKSQSAQSTRSSRYLAQNSTHRTTNPTDARAQSLREL